MFRAHFIVICVCGVRVERMSIFLTLVVLFMVVVDFRNVIDVAVETWPSYEILLTLRLLRVSLALCWGSLTRW